MPISTHEELKESIELLTNYRNRLIKEAADIAKKLQLSNEEVSDSLEKACEMDKIEKLIKILNSKMMEIDYQ